MMGKIIVVSLVVVFASSLAWGAYTTTKIIQKKNTIALEKRAAERAKDQQSKGATQSIINTIDTYIGEESTLEAQAVLDESKIITEQTTGLTSIGESIDAAIKE